MLSISSHFVCLSFAVMWLANQKGRNTNLNLLICLQNDWVMKSMSKDIPETVNKRVYFVTSNSKTPSNRVVNSQHKFYLSLLTTTCNPILQNGDNYT